jgi:hypothetical protein
MDHEAIRGGRQRSVSRIALLPLDDRPVNYDHPAWLARAAGLDLLRPPREWLGNPMRDAERDRLAGWLQDVAPTVDGLIVAIDTLAYGGLIPSRQSSTPLADVVTRLSPLRTIRAARPTIPVLGFSILMRVNRSNDAEEEKTYWAQHGRDLFRLSYLDDKVAVGDATATEAQERVALNGSVPADIVADYRTGRSRNHAINRLMLEWLADGTLDYVVIGQDDTVEYGWNIAESRALREQIRRDRLADRAAVYPGADELGSLLVAAMACRQAQFAPRVWPRYSGVNGPHAVTAYEDRPFEELLKAHLGPLGGSLAEGWDDADVILAVNAPGQAQAEAWLQQVVRLGATPPPVLEGLGAKDALTAVRHEMATVNRDIDEFARAIASDLARGCTLGVVDVAFVNGADLALAERLLASVPIGRLAAYGAWNTAGNSLGSALAQAVVRANVPDENSANDALLAHLSLLLIHLVDDYAFQTLVRTALLLEDLPELGVPPSFHRLPDDKLAEVEARLDRRLQPQVAELAGAFASHALLDRDGAHRRLGHVGVSAPRLPWRRLFEIAFEPRIELQ